MSNTETAWLKPAVTGAIVRDPVSAAALPADGAEKPLNSFWRRRIKDGSVVIGRRPKAAKRS